MGTKPAPSYANIFMARTIDQKLWDISSKYMENGTMSLQFMRKFLDDIFLLYATFLFLLHIRDLMISLVL